MIKSPKILLAVIAWISAMSAFSGEDVSFTPFREGRENTPGLEVQWGELLQYYPYTLQATLRNTTDTHFGAVEVRTRFFDGDGASLGEDIARPAQMALAPGATEAIEYSLDEEVHGWLRRIEYMINGIPGPTPPHLVQLRQQDNEARAISALRDYATAQTFFFLGKQGEESCNTTAGFSYADNFRNLYYGTPQQVSGRNLALIRKSIADAFLQEMPTETVAIVEQPSEGAAHYGYFFYQPRNTEIYRDSYELFAVPAGPEISNKVFHIRFVAKGQVAVTFCTVDNALFEGGREAVLRFVENNHPIKKPSLWETPRR